MRHFVPAFLLFVCISSAQPPVWLPAFQRAFDQLQRRDLNGARQQFESLWHTHPRDVRLATSIGGALDAASHHDEATAWYEKALAIEPDFGPALENLALNYAARGDLQRAAQLLRQQLKNAPEDSKAAYNLGLIDLRLAQYREAAPVLDRLLRAPDPPAPVSQIRLAEATALFHLAQYTKAANILVPSADTRSATEFALLGSAQALSGDLPAAIKTLQQGIGLYPAESQLYFRLALIFADGHRDQEAQSVLREAAQQIPQSPLIAYGQAVVDSITGLDEEAIRWAEKSLSLAERQPDAWGLLGALYERRARTDDAVRAYQKAVAYGAGSYTGAKYADLLIRLERLGEAEAELSRLAQRNPEDAQVHREFGKLYRAQGKLRLAEASLRRSIRRDPADPQAHYALAQVLQHEGRAAEAGSEFTVFKNTKEKSESVRILTAIE